MWYKDLFEKLYELGDITQGKKMSAYMQNKFEFLGIPKPKLTEFMKPYLKESKKYELDWDFIFKCFDDKYRESQYIAVTYLLQNIKKLSKEHLGNLKKLITTKSWWETVDSLDAAVGEIVFKNKELESVILDWSKDKDIWLRRVAIDFQQEYKENTNTLLLESIIVNNFGSEEFFINKAIGWSLRDYSKVNPEWVRSFIKKYENKLNKLSIKEASKYL